jgi:hypothetical protein
MMDTLLHPLCNQPQRPVHLIDIAGGPAIDSLNALILLHKNHPGILKERNLSIDVLDLDESGAKFGEAALAVLQAKPDRCMEFRLPSGMPVTIGPKP